MAAGPAPAFGCIALPLALTGSPPRPTLSLRPPSPPQSLQPGLDGCSTSPQPAAPTNAKTAKTAAARNHVACMKQRY
jgi:hypothetical protein